MTTDRDKKFINIVLSSLSPIKKPNWPHMASRPSFSCAGHEAAALLLVSCHFLRSLGTGGSQQGLRLGVSSSAYCSEPAARFAPSCVSNSDRTLPSPPDLPWTGGTSIERVQSVQPNPSSQ